MFPKRKTYLIGHEYQCKRTQKGLSLEDVSAIRKRWKDNKASVHPKSTSEFYVNGCLLRLPTRPRESWDIVRFTNSGYFNFLGERVSLKGVFNYNPAAGTFSTPDAFWQLYPLPEA